MAQRCPLLRDAETRHIDALAGLFARYGLPVPANPWPGRVSRYASVQAACEAGVAAETANGTMIEAVQPGRGRCAFVVVSARNDK